ncbi:hypothetical protein NOGI109294_05675 [Nocardiopsis gilva]
MRTRCVQARAAATPATDVGTAGPTRVGRWYDPRHHGRARPEPFVACRLAWLHHVLSPR